MPGAPVLEPPAGDGDELEELALVQADHELTAAGLDRRRLAPWASATAGPFTLTALPAADGVGDPQVAWLVEADGVRVLHLGDTMLHGAWWRMARRHGPFDVVLVPVNGAVVGFPHRRPASPLPVVLDPDQAAIAAEILGARLAIPIHAEGYEADGLYEPVPDAAGRFAAAAAERGVPVSVLRPGEAIEIVAAGSRPSGSAPVRASRRPGLGPWLGWAHGEQDVVHHRDVARLRPRVGDRRAGARRPRRRHRARRRHARRPGREYGDAVLPLALDVTDRDGGVRGRRAGRTSTSGASTSSSTTPATASSGWSRSSASRRPATRSRPTCSARCG